MLEKKQPQVDRPEKSVKRIGAHSRVRFHPYVKLYEIDYLPAEEVYYTDEDYSSFVLNCRADIHVLRAYMREGKIFDPSLHCIRGLESRVSFGAREQITTLRKHVTDAVMAEQNLQYDTDEFDSVRIASVSRILTRERAEKGRVSEGKVMLPRFAARASLRIPNQSWTTSRQ